MATTQPITVGEERTADVSTAVVTAVAEESGVDPTALPPLYERIDPDALDSLFATRPTGPSRAGTVEFHYGGYLITVSFDDGVTIALADRPIA